MRVAEWDLGEMSAVQVTGGLGEKSVRVAEWDLGEMSAVQVTGGSR